MTEFFRFTYKSDIGQRNMIHSPMDNEELDLGLSSAQILEFETENEAMLLELENSTDMIRAATQKLVEVAKLNEQIAQHLGISHSREF